MKRVFFRAKTEREREREREREQLLSSVASSGEQLRSFESLVRPATFHGDLDRRYAYYVYTVSRMQLLEVGFEAARKSSMPRFIRITSFAGSWRTLFRSQLFSRVKWNLSCSYFFRLFFFSSVDHAVSHLYRRWFNSLVWDQSVIYHWQLVR